MPAVQPKEDNGMPGGKALISPPKVFTGNHKQGRRLLARLQVMLAVELGPSSNESPIQPSNVGAILYVRKHSN